MATRVGAQKRVVPEGSVKIVCNHTLLKTVDKWIAVSAYYDLLGFAITQADHTNAAAAGIPTKPVDIVKELEAMITQNKANEGKGVDIDPPKWLNAFILAQMNKLLVT